MKKLTQYKLKIDPALFILLSLFLFSGCKQSQTGTAPTGLMTDLLLHPGHAVITNPFPDFSWIVNGQGKGAMQTAYQILVSSDLSEINKDRGNIWDSGMITSDESTSVPYNGEALNENTSYWWKVRTWDQNGEVGNYSTAQQFNIGDLKVVARKWPGESRWVTLKTNGETEHVFENRHPIRFHEIQPVSVIMNEAGNHFISFQKAAFGALKLTLDNPEKADTLLVHLGEKLTPGNQVDRSPGGSVAYNLVKLAINPGTLDYLVEIPRFIANWPNSQVLADHMPEVTPFRYVEIEGWPGDIKSSQVSQYALMYHFDDDASYFNSSDDNLNQIWDLCKHTLKVTPFMGVYIDGGARERMPYEADAYVQQISHYAVDREFAIQRYTASFLIFNPSWPTEWHLHMVLMAWADYMATGNTDFLEKYYEELKKKTLLPLAREDGLISTLTGRVTEEFLAGIHYKGTDFRDIVDWPQGTPANEPEMRAPLRYSGTTIEGETDRYVFSEINTVVNAFHYRNIVLMSKIAGILEKKEDEAFFKERAELVKTSFNEKLLNKETGLYFDGEGVNHTAFHASMFPVAFGLAPKAHYAQLREFLKSKGMACSPYGTPYLFDALYELNAGDYAFELLTSETDRSWMNMIRFGTTITSEAWDIKHKRNMTWNHAWGAAPAYIVTRGIFGIEPMEPAFKKILIRPQPGALESAEIKSPTIRGDVYAKFNNEPGKVFRLEVTIPGNTTAKVMLPLPGKEGFTLKLNGTEAPVVLEDGCVVVDGLIAGRYLMELSE